MSEKKTSLAAVSTFADHEVIMPPNKLKKAVQKLEPGEKAPFDPVARAEAALAELAADFSVWMDNECERLDAARNAIKAVRHHPGNKDALFLAAHDIKGEAATFGYPLVAPVADSLCRLIEHTPDIDAAAASAGRPARRRRARDLPPQYARRRRQVAGAARRKAAPGHRRISAAREPHSARLSSTAIPIGARSLAKGQMRWTPASSIARLRRHHHAAAGVVRRHQVVHLDQFVAEQPRLFARRLCRKRRSSSSAARRRRPAARRNWSARARPCGA